MCAKMLPSQVMLHVDIEALQKNNKKNHCRLDQDNWLHAETASACAVMPLLSPCWRIIREKFSILGAALA